jgi:hypothetical protein
MAFSACTAPETELPHLLSGDSNGLLPYSGYSWQIYESVSEDITVSNDADMCPRVVPQVSNWSIYSMPSMVQMLEAKQYPGDIIDTTLSSFNLDQIFENHNEAIEPSIQNWGSPALHSAVSQQNRKAESVADISLVNRANLFVLQLA